MVVVPAPPVLPVAARRGSAVEAGLRRLGDDGPTVGWFHLSGGRHRGAIGVAEGETIRRLVDAAVDAGVPVVGVVSTSGADIGEGVAALHAWGQVARSMSRASGVVPILLAVVGPCVSGPALLLGLADLVVMTPGAFAYVSGIAAVAGFTGMQVGHQDLGGTAVHGPRTGLAALLVDDEDEALLSIADILAYLPANNLAHPPVVAFDDPPDRRCTEAAAAVPELPSASYDVRLVVADVVDQSSFLELRALHAPNLVIGLAHIGGHCVGVVANQPSQLAGTLDIAASQKGARFVQWCDAFNLPLVSFVDTPGFQPGRDIEWRGMIRHGAELVHAYSAATVPRLSVILRKAYGGAYIVMDSKTMGNDLAVAWPDSEIAVMGASGAVQILHGKRLAAMPEDGRAAARARLESDYRRDYCSPSVAAQRGYIDEVIDPLDTRRVLVGALEALVDKRDHTPRRRHSNSPL